MKLPDLKHALVEKQKVTAYLLSDENSGGKAAFFTHVGFSAAQWEDLRKALLAHAASHEVVRVIESEHGTKYVIEGELQTPSGETPPLRAIWIVDLGRDYARLVTAYPL